MAEATLVGEVSAPRPLSNAARCHSKIHALARTVKLTGRAPTVCELTVR
eukprot:COSAG02_NODE_35_length_49339_cov_20.375102_16_plen_49_part_00